MKITKRQFNLIVENYLMSEIKYGTAEFEFKNSCDMSDIEFTKGYKAWKAFSSDKRVQECNNNIRAIEAAINNPTGTGPDRDDFVAKKIDELEKEKAILVDLTKEKVGPFGITNLAGLTSPVFQGQLLKVLGFGMLVTMGPSANLYCNSVRSIVNVLNKAADAAYGAKRAKEEVKTVEFDFFYNALESIANPILRSLANSKQEDVWASAISELSLSKNAMSLFKFIYCVTGKKIDIKFPDSGGIRPIGSPRSEYYRDDVKRAAEVYLNNIKSGLFRKDGKKPAGTTSSAIKLKQEFIVMVGYDPSRDEFMQGLTNYINNKVKYGADGKVSRSNFASLSQTIAEKQAQEQGFYRNLLNHIKGTLDSVPG